MAEKKLTMLKEKCGKPFGVPFPKGLGESVDHLLSYEFRIRVLRDLDTDGSLGG